MSNLHPCANKCSEYKAEQCKSCLIQETKVQGVYVMGKADDMGDDAHIENRMFKVGDIVLYEKTKYTYEVVKMQTRGLGLKHLKTKVVYAMPHPDRLRHASQQEIKAGYRLDHVVDVADMGDDAHIENHISPNCKACVVGE